MNENDLNLYPVPEEFIPYTNVSDSDEPKWLSQKETGYEYYLGRNRYGKACLFRVFTSGMISPDKDSMLVEDLKCPKCKETMKPLIDAAGNINLDFYSCDSCNISLIFGGTISWMRINQ